MKSLGIFIATPGRRSLYRTLHSIAYQKDGVEDVLVVGDGYHKPTDELVQLVAAATGLPCRYVATTRTRDWGHSQQNYALKHVRGDYLIYQDDDDIFLPRSLEEARLIVSEFDAPHPLIGRIKTPNLGLLWTTPGYKTLLDGHCIVVPNDKKKLGYFIPDYIGDQCYISTSSKPYDTVSWVDRVWSLARPRWKLFPWSVLVGSCTWGCDFYEGTDVPSENRVASLLLESDEHDRLYATIATERPLTLSEYTEIVEFAVYACQGKDCWLTADPTDHNLIQALRDSHFSEHATKGDRIEYTHDWPPDFWTPVKVPTMLTYADGIRIRDWRDDWSRT